MVSIMQTEFFRLKKSKLFWALLGVTAALPLISALLNLGIFLIAGSEFDGLEVNIWDLIRSTNMLGSGLSNLTTMMGDSFLALICTSIFLSKEFSGGTFRNMILANKSRRDLYLAFLSMALLIGAIYFGASFVSTFVFYSAFFGVGGLSAKTIISALFITLAMGLVSKIFVQTMMCMFMFGTRKLAVALICPLVICMIFPSFLITFIDVFVEFELLNKASLSWIPLYNTTMLSVIDIDGALVGKILMYNIPLSVFFGFMGWLRFRKADLK